ncbi:EscU/YscU/HrcU family type III secretion system export apparatus switch protein [Roseateles sp. SL47]|uniref:EscU/YscU/HrcU family type III secretion system export apparatus switch protein n=1 Tax=Roseateles sp. SL47 TaxID=2995138 RepID=UPI0022715C34|nr:EscU/YscU/HrcU family type III secretion system export apparatus switch protein [Roseateles sp. SL47]WAC74583.1 EscU/YscU/HrcU family type III secretion system export apparatus switch protein [Roseateles sp. SL47]
MSEKNKPPTRKRLQESREEGQVAQTPSIPHFLAAVGCFELIVGTSHLWLQQAAEILGSYVGRVGQHQPMAPIGVKDLLVPLAGVGLGAALMVLLLAALLGLIGNIAQTGIVIATNSFLKFERLNPVEHAQQLFSSEQLGKLLMDVLKVSAIFGCGVLAVLMSMDSLLRLADGTLIQGVQVVLAMLLLCERLALIVLVICVVMDWALRRHAHNKSLMMTREEVEREQKDQFGDRHVRAQRNEFRRDVLAGELTENTRKANAVVTNPTHFAVALLYDPKRFPLPVVVARGSDEAAAHMRRVAKAHGIPIVRSPPLARLLYRTGKEWRPVPRLALKSVAAVYRVVAQIQAGERRVDEDLHVDDDTPEHGPSA